MDPSVREAAHDAKGPLYVAPPAATRIDHIATHMFRGAPDDIARLGFAVAHALDAGAPGPEGLPQDIDSLATDITGARKSAKRPVVISGAGCGSAAVIQATANAALALGGAALSFAVPE